MTKAFSLVGTLKGLTSRENETELAVNQV